MTSVPSAESPFVGRDAELAELVDALRVAIDGRASFACIVGEPGIGKTRLAGELAERARTVGVAVLVGRCTEARATRPFWPWIEALRSSRDPELVASREVLARKATIEAGSDARDDAFESIADALAGAPRTGALLLVLDDLQWCDVPSAALLRFVCRSVRDAPVLVVSTWRDTDLEGRPELARELHRVARECRRHGLAGLGENAIAAYLGAFPNLAITASPAVLHRRSAGNPLFLGEIVAAAASGRADATELPATVRGAIEERLSYLADDVRETLDAAAVASDALDVTELSTLLGRARSSVVDAFTVARRAGLVRTSGDGKVEFVHDVVREALLDALAATRRSELHLRVAEALHERADASDDAGLVAHHYLASGTASSIDEAIRWGRRAAQDALSRGACEAAAELLERLLSVARGGVDSERTAILAAELAEARMLAGDRARGIPACERAVELSRRAGSGRALALAALAAGIDSTHGHVERAHVALLEEALGAIDEHDVDLRARAMARLAAALQPCESPERPLALARDAIALARALGTEETLARTLALARGAFRPIEDLGERRAIDEESLVLAESLRDRNAQLLALGRLACEALEAGDRTQADDHVHAYARLARDVGSRRAASRAAHLEAMLATLDGDAPRAKARWAHGSSLATTTRDDRTTLDAPKLQRLFLSRGWGDAAAIEEALEGCPLPPELEIARGGALLALGRLDEARDILSRSLARPGAPSFQRLVGSAEPCAAVGDRESASAIYSRLLPFAERNVVWWGSAGACDGSVARLLALLAARLGDRDRAHAHFEKALEQNLRLAAPVLVARTREEFARFLLDEASDDARARALELVAHALDTYRARALALDADRIEELLPTKASRLESHRASGDLGARLAMHREGDVWTIVSGRHRAVVKDGDGLRYLAYLVDRPEVDLHVLELVGESRARRTTAFDPARPAGDSLPALDAEAKRAYRTRLAELRADRDRASAWSDEGRVEAIDLEIEHLANELARALGLAGRDRPRDATSERARANVTQRIRGAIAKIGAQCPPLAHELEGSIRTGTFCRYRPRPSA